MASRLGIDLGGTKIEIIALDDTGFVKLRERVPTPRGDYPATLETLAALVKKAEQKLQAHCSVGVGIPGALSRVTGLVKNANSTWLIGKPLQQDLERMLNRKVRVANDANCFALSEAVDGAGQGAEAVFGVILGTGVGGALVVRRRVLTGCNAIAGEWGHNPLPLPSPDDLPLPACYCGRVGCIETYLSGPGMSADHRKLTEQSKSAIDIADAASQDDAACLATLERYERRLARALAGVINVVDPDVIVLGGGLSNVDRLYDRIPRLWSEHVFSDRVDTVLARNQHGDSGGVRGAAWLWGRGAGTHRADRALR